MAHNTAIVRMEEVAPWTYKAPGPVVRVFDECPRGLIPVSHIRVGSYVRVVNGRAYLQ